MVKEELKEYGLSDKEIEVYLCLIKMGQLSITSIADATRMPKSTCYDVLNSLVSKGLASSIIQKKIKHFEALDPTSLISKLHEKEDKMNEIMPELKGLWHSVSKRPRVELYQGKIVLKTIYDNILKEKPKEFLAIENQKNFIEFYKGFPLQFINKRIKSRIRCRCVAEQSDISKNMKSLDKKELRNTKLAKFMNNQKIELYIFGDNVVFMNLSEEEPIGIVVENKQIASFMTGIFEEIYKNIK